MIFQHSKNRKVYSEIFIFISIEDRCTSSRGDSQKGKKALCDVVLNFETVKRIWFSKISNGLYISRGIAYCAIKLDFAIWVWGITVLQDNQNIERRRTFSRNINGNIKLDNSRPRSPIRMRFQDSVTYIARAVSMFRTLIRQMNVGQTWSAACAKPQRGTVHTERKKGARERERRFFGLGT